MGGMRFQLSWTDSGQDLPVEAQQRLADTIRAGLAAGVNHVETARGYGTSERQLGLLLRDELDRDAIVLQTKVAPEPDPELFRANVLDSVRRLGVERVDLFAIHGVNSWEKLWWTARPGGCLAVARELQRDGLLGAVGLSTHGTAQLISQALLHDGDGGFDFVNLHWYFINQQLTAVLDLAARRDIGVFVISPSDKGGRLYDPPQRLVDLCAPLHPIVFNNAYCLARPEIHTLSLGAARPSDFDLVAQSLAAAEQPELLAGIEARLHAAMTEAVGVGHPDDLTAGLPAWSQVSGGLNVAVIVWLRALALGWGMIEYAQGRYRLLGNGGDWFPGVNAAHVDEVDLSDALAGSPHAAAIPGWLREAHDLLGGAAAKRLSRSG